MWSLVLCSISGILLGVLFSLQSWSSKFEYDEKLLERVIRNDILLKDALDKITETQAKVEHVLTRIIEDNAKADVKLNYAVNTQDVKRKDLDDDVESFINSVTRNVSVTVEEMKASLKSLVLQTDNELKAKTRQIDEKVEDFIDSASQKVHRNVTELTSAVQLLVQRTASELDIIKAQRVVPLVIFEAVLDSIEQCMFQSNTNVVFSKVMANDGRGYDPETGKFTAPVAGVYIFTVQYCTYDNREAGFEIVQEGRPLQRSAHASCSKTTVCVHMQVVAKVKRGDKVWVRATADDSTIYPEPIRWNTFAGLLIHAIEN